MTDRSVAGGSGDTTDVLVVGGGLVGLAAALFLGRHGVRVLLVERHATTSTHPRARGVNPRTMELLRSAGLEDEVRATASARSLAGNDGVIAVSSLAGDPLGVLHQPYFDGIHADLREISPTGWCLCDQDELEPVLRVAADRAGAELRFGTELAGFTQDADGVTATVRDAGGSSRRIRASYLIGADGPGGLVRRALGVGMSGPGTLGHFLNIYFRADLSAALGGRRFLLCYVLNRTVMGALLPVDNARRWLLHVPIDQETDLVDEFPPDRCAELARAAAGLPGADVEVVEALPWESAGRTADRLRVDRVFLAGDAAHVMPPTGAFGSNTGIQDAHNLAWKLAAVVHGEAGPGLLDSYEAERRPVAEGTVDQAVRRSKDRRRMAGTKRPPTAGILADRTVIFGQWYASGAVVATTDADRGGPPPDGRWADQLDGRPGTRAPHVPLICAGIPISTLDLFGDGFLLLAGAPATEWTAAAAAVPGRVHALSVGSGGDVADPTGQWAARYGLGPYGAVLVRPDGVVGWRAPEVPDDPAAALAAALGALLAVTAATGR